MWEFSDGDDPWFDSAGNGRGRGRIIMPLLWGLILLLSALAGHLHLRSTGDTCAREVYERLGPHGVVLGVDVWRARQIGAWEDAPATTELDRGATQSRARELVESGRAADGMRPVRERMLPGVALMLASCAAGAILLMLTAVRTAGHALASKPCVG